MPFRGGGSDGLPGLAVQGKPGLLVSTAPRNHALMCCSQFANQRCLVLITGVWWPFGGAR